MQLVSREVLFDVMSHKHPVKFKLPAQLDEEDGIESSSAFKSFMTSASKLYDKSNKHMNDFNRDMFYFMQDN